MVSKSISPHSATKSQLEETVHHFTHAIYEANSDGLRVKNGYVCLYDFTHKPDFVGRFYPHDEHMPVFGKAHGLIVPHKFLEFFADVGHDHLAFICGFAGRRDAGDFYKGELVKATLGSGLLRHEPIDAYCLVAGLRR